MNNNRSILLVDDQQDVLRSLSLLFRTEKFTNVTAISNSEEVMPYLKTTKPDVILLDIHMPVIEGNELLKLIKRDYPEIIVIMVTANDQVSIAVECTKLGAHDYFVKPVDQSRLIHVIKNALENKSLSDELMSVQNFLMSVKQSSNPAFTSILTVNEEMKKLFVYIEAIAQSKRPVLILGETGTGKELIAQAVYDVSNKKGKMVSVNIAGLDDTAFSDTLFGHKKGAFTGASTSREGLIKQAGEGAIFLDEIGDLDHQSQIKLLRLIQENNYYPLGSDTLEENNARIITATHHELNKLITEGNFRQDLFYRLQIHTIRIPPLRERKEDIPLLCEYFLIKACNELQLSKIEIPDSLYEFLSQYDFPGNVRELEMLIYDSVTQTTGSVLNVEHLQQQITINSASTGVNDDYSDLGSNLDISPETKTLPTIKEFNDNLIKEALRRTNNNQSEAAKILGLTRQALNKRLTRNKTSD